MGALLRGRLRGERPAACRQISFVSQWPRARVLPIIRFVLKGSVKDGKADDVDKLIKV